MAILDALSLNTLPDLGSYDQGSFQDNAFSGNEWTDISRLRDLSGAFCPEELKQKASTLLPDELNLESVFASFAQLQNPTSIGTGGLATADYSAGLPFTDELSNFFFPDTTVHENKTNDLTNGAANQFSSNGFSDYSFSRGQEFSYNGVDSFDVQTIRKDFPILHQKVNGKDLIWFDNAATTQKPIQVINALSNFYKNDNSNIHRAAHSLAARSTDAYEGSREIVQHFINASSPEEIIFVRGTTEGINLVAKTYGQKFIQEGDEIIVSTLDHHANIVPWQQLAKEKKAKLLVIPINDNGDIILEEYERLLSPRTKIVSFGQVNNTFGTVLPVKVMIDMAKRYGARVLIDGAQSIAHTPVDVQALDFFVFSGHKIYAPNGIGVVYGKKELLEIMPPWQGGGNMIQNVTFEETTFNGPPARFEAGTPNIADAVGLGVALEYVSRIGLPVISKYEHFLTEYARVGLEKINGLRIIGNPKERVSVVSFELKDVPTPEVGRLLDKEAGIALRAGHHCAQPALRRLGVEASVRPSFSFYNTTDEIDRLVEAVKRINTRR
jgi:cysteine desulfurase / selenocysteine lyase